MLAVLPTVGQASERKLRLFAAACYSRWPLCRHEKYRGILEAADRHAEAPDFRMLRGALDQALKANGNLTNPATAVVGMDALGAASWTASEVTAAMGDAEAANQAELLRCIFGVSPFR